MTPPYTSPPEIAELSLKLPFISPIVAVRFKITPPYTYALVFSLIILFSIKSAVIEFIAPKFSIAAPPTSTKSV